MSAGASTPQEVELPLRARLSVPEEPGEHQQRLITSSQTLPASSQQPLRPRASRRSVLAETSKDLEKSAAPKHQRCKVAVAAYTVARITASVLLLLQAHSACYERCLRDSACGKAFREEVMCPLISGRIFDSVVRPLVTGLGIYVFLQRSDRFSANEPLHTRARFLVFCLASFHCDASVAVTLFHRSAFPALLLLWELLCNAIQMQMTNLKLHALGFHITARLCAALMLVVLGAIAVDLPFFVFSKHTWLSQMMWPSFFFRHILHWRRLAPSILWPLPCSRPIVVSGMARRGNQGWGGLLVHQRCPLDPGTSS